MITNMKISGTGSFVPSIVCTNEYLATKVDTTPEWIYANLGIKERRIANLEENTSDLAYWAGKRAIEDAALKPEDIDMIILATTTPDRQAPSTACLVQERLGCTYAAAFDINAVCTGFLYALSIASQFIHAGTYTHILVIGADTFSKITDWTKRDCVFFGDGAGAVVVSQNNKKNGYFNFKLHADGTGKDNFTIPITEPRYFTMNGKAVYNTATTVLPVVIEEVLYDSHLTIDDVTYMIPHQPSINILKETARKIHLPFEQVLTNMDKYANTSGATIPILLDETKKKGLLHRNDAILFAAVGSGWTYGAAIMRWI